MTLPEPFDPASTAVLAIDLHRGYLDPTVSARAIAPSKIAPLLAANGRLLDLARARGMPVVHAVLSPENLRGQRDPRLRNPRFRWRDALAGPPPPLIDPARMPAERNGADVHPTLGPRPGDLVIDTKSSMSCFYATELDRLLHTLRVDTLLIGGINTNTCVQCAAFDCFNRHLRAVVVEECVATGYGDDLHAPALENIRRCLGWVATLAEVGAALGAGARLDEMAGVH